jgi:hypothetical protein
MRWVLIAVGLFLLWGAIEHFNAPASNDCGPYNISQEDCRRIKSMTQDELQQAVEQDDEEKRRDYYRGR